MAAIIAFHPVRLFIFTLLSIAIPALSQAQDGKGEEAKAAVRSVINQLKEIVAENRATDTPEQTEKRLHDILYPVFDFDELSRGCLGSNWLKANADERKEFVRLFSELLSRTYLSKIRKNIEGSEVDFMPSVVKDQRVVVKSKIKNEEGEISADYRLHQKDTKWMVYDIVIENIGLVTNYRSEFSAIIRKEGFPGLLAKLEERVSSLATKKA